MNRAKLAAVDGEAELLESINRDLPPGVDWKRGAREYLAEAFRRYGKENLEFYLYSKLFAPLPPIDHERSLAVFSDLLANFLNVVNLLKLPPGSRILDVACGGGWLSHYLTKLGFEVTGVDICPEMLDYARKRLKSDLQIGRSVEQIDQMFVLADIENEPIPVNHTFAAAIFESCLHHFYNPVAALRRVVQVLNPHGLAVLIEAENRDGPIKAEFAQVMTDFQTIERPYTRDQLNCILDLVGLPCREYFAPVNGWFSSSGPDTSALSQHRVPTYERIMNLAVCGKSEEALQRVLPWRAAGAVQFREGFTEGGVEGRMWSAPYSRLRFSRSCNAVTLEVGSSLVWTTGESQEVAIYFSGRVPCRPRQVITLTPSEAVKFVTLQDVEEGEILDFCSSRLFCPAWTGSTDLRILSFWVGLAQ